jgi:peroxiredoxin
MTPSRSARTPARATEASRAGRTRAVSPGIVTVTSVVSLVTVLLLVLAALWADRGRHDPVPPFGLMPPPGMATDGAWSPAPGGALEAGDEAPNFLLRTADGEVVELAALRGQVVVLHFWTTWCLDCRAEMPALGEVGAADGVTVLGVAVDEPAGRVEDAVAGLDVPYLVALDADGEVALAYGAGRPPVTVVLDAGGTVHAVTYGPLAADALVAQVSAARDAPGES